MALFGRRISAERARGARLRRRGRRGRAGGGAGDRGAGGDAVAAGGRGREVHDPGRRRRGPRRADRGARQRHDRRERGSRRRRRRLPRQAQARVSGEIDDDRAGPDSRCRGRRVGAAGRALRGAAPDRRRLARQRRRRDLRAASRRPMASLVTRAAKGGAAETEAAIAAARAAFDDGRWSELSGKERATLLLKVADLIDRDRERIARVETLEAGKPIAQARAEIEGAADLWRYAAALARTLSGDSHNSLGRDMLGVVLKEPIGVASIICPWNFPFLIVSQKLPFALAAGCTAVVKPSEMTPSTTVILGELLVEAGLPAGVVNIVLGYGQPVGAMMTTDPRVDMVTFTGSTGVGKAIVAAAAPTLKKVSLELGGKNPQVIFPDADLDSAVDAIVFGVYFNAGECCNSGSRIIVHEDIAEAVTERVVALSRKVAFGEPLDEATKVGAIVSPEHQAKIDGYVKGAVAAGATVRLGGAPLEVPGLARAVLPADRGRGRDARHGDRAGGGVRAGSVGADLPHARRGGRARQRRRLRPFGRGLERERPHLPGVRAGGAGGHGLDQHLDGRLRRAAVRRREGERPGARARPLRARGVPRGEDRADADRPHTGALGDDRADRRSARANDYATEEETLCVSIARNEP